MSDVTERAQQTDAGAPGGTPTGSSTQPAPAAGDTRTLTQEQFNAALAEEKRTWKKQQDEAAAKVKREAEDKAAAERGEWEKIARERTAERDRIAADHTTAAERLTALTDAMEKQIKVRVKALPEELQGLIPESADVLTRYELIGKAEAAAARLTAAPRTPGTPSGPSRTQAAAPNDLDKLMAEHRARIGGL